MIPNRQVDYEADAEETRNFIKSNLFAAAKASYKQLGVNATEDVIDEAYESADNEGEGVAD